MQQTALYETRDEQFEFDAVAEELYYSETGNLGPSDLGQMQMRPKRSQPASRLNVKLENNTVFSAS